MNTYKSFLIKQYTIKTSFLMKQQNYRRQATAQTSTKGQLYLRSSLISLFNRRYKDLDEKCNFCLGASVTWV